MGGTGQVGDPGVTALLLLAPTLWEQGIFFSCRFSGDSPLPLSFSEARTWLENILWLFSAFPSPAWCLCCRTTCCIPACVGCGWDGTRSGALPSRDLGLRHARTWVCCMAQMGWVPDTPTFYFPAESIATCLEDPCFPTLRPAPFTAAFQFRGGKVADGTIPCMALFAPCIQQCLGPDFFSKTFGSHLRSWVCE